MHPTAAILLLSYSLCAAQSQFEFSRTDLTLWQCSSLAPQLSYQTGVGGAVGSQTNLFDGDSYWINAKNDSLVKDSTELPLTWYDGKLFDAQPIHGFVISDGFGWLASQDANDSATSFLVKIDLDTGASTPIGPLGDSPYPVTGMTVIPEPSTWKIVMASLFLGVICWTVSASAKRR